MKNSEIWKRYQEYTRDLTENSRKLGYAAIAMCWLFKLENFSFPKHINFAVGFIVVFFISDIFQSLFGAILIRLWVRHHEKKIWEATKNSDNQTIEGDYYKPAWLDYPSFSMWCLKILSLLIGYSFIGYQIFVA